MHLAPSGPEIWAVSPTETDFEGSSSFSDIAKRVRGISGGDRGADLGEPNGASDAEVGQRGSSYSEANR
jgi:hypothetical protein